MTAKPRKTEELSQTSRETGADQLVESPPPPVSGPRVLEAIDETPRNRLGVLDARNRARVSPRVTARNAPTTRSDDMRMTDTPPPAPENPEDQHLALMTALMKIFATGRDDEDR